MLEIGAVLMQKEMELILKSRRVVPGRLVGGGFAFKYPSGQMRPATSITSGRAHARMDAKGPDGPWL